MNGTPTNPTAPADPEREGAVTGAAAAEMTMVTVAVPVWLPTVAEMEDVYVPPAVGDPEIKPVTVLIDKPGGRLAAP